MPKLITSCCCFCQVEHHQFKAWPLFVWDLWRRGITLSAWQFLSHPPAVQYRQGRCWRYVLMGEGGERVHPDFYPEIHEPLSPSGRSTATGLSYQSNFRPINAYTTPGFTSPARPPPTEVGRPARKPHHRKGLPKGCRSCLIVGCSILAFLIFAIGFSALVLWLVYRPKIPKYSVQDVHVSQLNVTSKYVNTTDSQAQPTYQPVLNTNITYTILAQNPNHKIGIDYNQVNIYATYEGTMFGQCTLPGWYQDVDNTTLVYADISATNAPLTTSEGSALQSDMKNNNIPLHARIDIRAAIKVGSWKTPAVWIHVDCDFQVSPPTAPGGAKLLNKSCKWKWRG